MQRGVLNICLIISLSSINLKSVSCYKCEYELKDNKYSCRVEAGSKNNEQHLTAKNGNDVERIQFNGTENEISLLTESKFPFCQRFKSLEKAEIEKIDAIDANVLQECKNLKDVVIQHTNIHNVPEKLFFENLKITKIDLNDNKFTTLPENVFSNQNELERLILRENQINILPPNIFKSLKNLRTLWLSFNKIQTINPAWFKNLENLELLEMRSNEISDLPKNAFSSLTKLKHLNLNSNNLTVIHSDSFGLHKQRLKVNLLGNEINAIDEKFIDNPAVDVVKLDEGGCTKEDLTFKKDSNNEEELRECFDNYQPRKEQMEHCGKPKVGLQTVFGGTAVERGAYPWSAALLTTSGKFFCGGTLISNKTVVTAAHCIKGKSGSHNFGIADFLVKLGAHDLSKPEHDQVTKAVKSIHVHSDWNPHISSFDADIAILELVDEIQFNNFIQPICLIEPDSPESKISHGKIVGFGKSEDGSAGNIARVIRSPIVSNQNCSTNPTLESILSSRMFCGGYANGTGSCTGDSGSSLIVYGEENFFLHGIVSASLRDKINDCNIDEHSVFTDVLKFNSWIKSGGTNECEDKVKMLGGEVKKQERKNKQLEEEIKILKEKNEELSSKIETIQKELDKQKSRSCWIG